MSYEAEIQKRVTTLATFMTEGLKKEIDQDSRLSAAKKIEKKEEVDEIAGAVSYLVGGFFSNVQRIADAIEKK